MLPPYRPQAANNLLSLFPGSTPGNPAGRRPALNTMEAPVRSLMRVLFSLALGMSALLPRAASAQQHAQTREGFWFNGGLGYGSLGCQDCGSREGSISGGLAIGGPLSKKLLLGVGTNGWT